MHSVEGAYLGAAIDGVLQEERRLLGPALCQRVVYLEQSPLERGYDGKVPEGEPAPIIKELGKLPCLSFVTQSHTLTLIMPLPLLLLF